MLPLPYVMAVAFVRHVLEGPRVVRNSELSNAIQLP